MYETLTSSSYGTSFKCLQLHGTTVLSSQSDDEDDDWEGEEGKWKSSYHDQSHTCLLYEMPPNALVEF